MRIAIREQLAAVVVLAVGVALTIVSIPTWAFVNDFVVGVSKDALLLTASLKAARISSEINLIRTACATISSRVTIQDALEQFYENKTAPGSDIFKRAEDDLKSALRGSGFSGLLQARLYSRNPTGDDEGLISVAGTGTVAQGSIPLPYLTPDGAPALLGDAPYGFPPSLYPNITYRPRSNNTSASKSTRGFSAEVFPGVSLGEGPFLSGVLLGPYVVNSTFSLMSITIPVRRLNSRNVTLGYLTVVASTQALVEVQQSTEGLGRTGRVLFIGSVNPWNHFDISTPASNEDYTPPLEDFRNQEVRFLFPPQPAESQPDLKSRQDAETHRYRQTFALKQYPALLEGLRIWHESPLNSISDLSTTTEQGVRVAVGVARPQTPLVSWAIVVEQDESEAYEPIKTLRTILLGCVFGTLGTILLIVFPFAHWSVNPIRRLKEATENSIDPPGYDDDIGEPFDEENPSSGATSSGKSTDQGIMARLRRAMSRKPRMKLRPTMPIEPDRGKFKIPAKVKDKKHFITDELTELTQTFNQMTEELMQQYTSLDEKVAERTRELEISKKAAEAANESKTLFIANISHELKTPLNGIMGLCAVCMEEDDILRIKQSLKTVYKSGDLLLHLLEDLLSFSKNQIGQQVALEEREFCLGEVRSQILAIFDKQVRESKVRFGVSFVSSEGFALTDSRDTSTDQEGRTSLDKRLPALGPPGTGRIKDMCLWGDMHRILQVIINLVSNSLKFTPPGGVVELRIRYAGEVEPSNDDSRTSSFSKTGSVRVGRTRHRVGSASTNSASSKGPGASILPATGATALVINPVDSKPMPQIHISEMAQTPPPPNARTFLFEFEVEDTGPGIPGHLQQKIFEPFVQGDLGLSRKYGGTGLGLSICAQLAKLMGGTISVKSTEGVGTTFTMQIPLKYVKDRTSSTSSSSVKSRPSSAGSVEACDNPRNSTSSSPTVLDQQPRLVGLRHPFFATTPNRLSTEDQLAVIDRAMANKSGQGRLKVLVADDNSTNIEVVSRLLKLEEIYDVTIAKDGQEAYELVKATMENNQHFDLIFMDIQMPNLDGLQTTRLIRKMGYSAPIVALTAFSEESNIKECLESGMNEFLSKPIRRPALKQVLKKFSTILEEPETASLGRKTSTPESKTPLTTPDLEMRDPIMTMVPNGDVNDVLGEKMNGVVRTDVTDFESEKTV
ncbi:hypothetical protein VTJ49DRAFT_6163 [Mycothermus thermophilus]|uniref:Uncharacterized protein n=1 Tax=Humicola insolens TaxID=85995 RepID=A0ABR3V1X1_HUMIN